MKTARRALTIVAVMAVAMVSVPGAAQTVSQRCAHAVGETHPEAGSVWVASVVIRDGETVADWQSASGRVGTCTLNAAGEVTDVRATGTRRAAGPAVELGPEETPGDFEPYRVTCESIDRGRAECAVEPGAAVTLLEVLGDSSCAMDSSWGHDGEVLWVDGGCRATFDVRPVTRPVVVAAPSASSGDLADQVSEPELRTLKGRAQNACLRAAAQQGAMATTFFATRAEGAYVIVLMAVESWAQKGEVTCRYDPTNDVAVIAR